MEAMIRRILSIRSRGAAPGNFRSRGFTLVEVLMTVVLLGIGMALALPSYRDMVEKRQVTNGAEQLSAFINTAQGIAQGLNRKVNVSYEPYGDDEWCIGMAEDDALCDCENSPESCLINGQQYVINSSHAGNRTMMHSVTGA